MVEHEMENPGKVPKPCVRTGIGPPHRASWLREIDAIMGTFEALVSDDSNMSGKRPQL